MNGESYNEITNILNFSLSQSQKQNKTPHSDNDDELINSFCCFAKFFIPQPDPATIQDPSTLDTGSSTEKSRVNEERGSFFIFCL